MSANAKIAAVFDAADLAFAEKTADALAQFGFAATLFNYSTPPESYVDTANYLLLIFSQNAQRTEHWQAAFMAFAKRQKPLCVVRVDDVILPDTLLHVEWVDFSFGHQVGINGLVYALQNPKSASIEISTVINTQAAQERVLRGTLIALAILIVGMIILALVF